MAGNWEQTHRNLHRATEHETAALTAEGGLRVKSHTTPLSSVRTLAEAAVHWSLPREAYVAAAGPATLA